MVSFSFSFGEHRLIGRNPGNQPEYRYTDPYGNEQLDRGELRQQREVMEAERLHADYLSERQKLHEQFSGIEQRLIGELSKLPENSEDYQKLQTELSTAQTQYENSIRILDAIDAQNYEQTLAMSMVYERQTFAPQASRQLRPQELYQEFRRRLRTKQDEMARVRIMLASKDVLVGKWEQYLAACRDQYATHTNDALHQYEAQTEVLFGRGARRPTLEQRRALDLQGKSVVRTINIEGSLVQRHFEQDPEGKERLTGLYKQRTDIFQGIVERQDDVGDPDQCDLRMFMCYLRSERDYLFAKAPQKKQRIRDLNALEAKWSRRVTREFAQETNGAGTPQERYRAAARERAYLEEHSPLTSAARIEELKGVEQKAIREMANTYTDQRKLLTQDPTGYNGEIDRQSLQRVLAAFDAEEQYVKRWVTDDETEDPANPDRSVRLQEITQDRRTFLESVNEKVQSAPAPSPKERAWQVEVAMAELVELGGEQTPRRAEVVESVDGLAEQFKNETEPRIDAALQSSSQQPIMDAIVAVKIEGSTLYKYEHFQNTRPKRIQYLQDALSSLKARLAQITNAVELNTDDADTVETSITAIVAERDFLISQRLADANDPRVQELNKKLQSVQDRVGTALRLATKPESLPSNTSSDRRLAVIIREKKLLRSELKVHQYLLAVDEKFSSRERIAAINARIPELDRLEARVAAAYVAMDIAEFLDQTKQGIEPFKQHMKEGKPMNEQTLRQWGEYLQTSKQGLEQRAALLGQITTPAVRPLVQQQLDEIAAMTADIDQMVVLHQPEVARQQLAETLKQQTAKMKTLRTQIEQQMRAGDFESAQKLLVNECVPILEQIEPLGIRLETLSVQLAAKPELDMEKMDAVKEWRSGTQDFAAFMKRVQRAMEIVTPTII